MKFPAFCLLLSTGKKVVCSDFSSFSSKTMEYLGDLKDKEQEVTTATLKAVGVQPVEEIKMEVEAPTTGEAADVARFEELRKMKAWMKWQPEELRNEYLALKEKLA